MERKEKVLVLGGTRGLGREIARLSLERGYETIIVGRSATRAQDDPALAGARCIVADLTTPEGLSEVNLAEIKYTHVFLVAGASHPRWRMDEYPSRDFHDALNDMLALHVSGPILVLRFLHTMAVKMASETSVRPCPYHLITISSTTSYKMRDGETLYAMAQAAKSTFARHFGRELPRVLPGSKSMLVHPGGMRTEFFARSGIDQDTTNFMDPAAVAACIWAEVTHQSGPWNEVSVIRDPLGNPQTVYGAQAPEPPFGPDPQPQNVATLNRIDFQGCWKP
jgi:NAD(P)-dependent dehydrogenase (short-subunit alcohol dehydrogenase family)